MKHGSLFSGIGGFDLAAEWAGWDNVFNCEIDTFCKTILKYYWPDAEQYSDIRTTDFTIWRGRIDVLSGGFPCQPFSQAWKRKGTEDERHLWPEMLRAIREIQPRWVVGENVLGIVNWSNGMVFEQVCADLEAKGYEVQPYIIPAAGVGAPHQRYRTWFVAHANSVGDSGNTGTIRSQELGQEWDVFCEFDKPDLIRRISTNPNISRCEECWPKWFTSREFTQNYGLTSEPGICRGDDGFSFRVDRLKALGNAVVPQVVLQLFETINAYENL